MLRNRSHALMAVAMKFGSVEQLSVSVPVVKPKPLGQHTGGGSVPVASQELQHVSWQSRQPDADTAATFTETSTNPPYNTDWHIHVASCDWATGDFAYFIDGCQIGSTQTTQAPRRTPTTPTSRRTMTLHRDYRCAIGIN